MNYIVRYTASAIFGLGLLVAGAANAALYNYSSTITLCTGTCASFASLDLGSTITGTLDINTTPGGSFSDADINTFQFQVLNPALPFLGWQGSQSASGHSLNVNYECPPPSGHFIVCDLSLRMALHRRKRY